MLYWLECSVILNNAKCEVCLMEGNWEGLRQQCLGCQKCGLAAGRTNVVFGTGSSTAEVLPPFPI